MSSERRIKQTNKPNKIRKTNKPNTTSKADTTNKATSKINKLKRTNSKDSENGSCRKNYPSFPLSVWFPFLSAGMAYITCIMPYIHDTLVSTKIQHQYLDVSHIKWVPMRTANIHDPVDESNYSSYVLDKISPKIYSSEDMEVVPLEIKHQNKKSSVRMYLIDDILSKEECDGLKQVHDQLVAESLKVADPIICFDTVGTLAYHLNQLNRSEIQISKDLFTPNTICLNQTLSSRLKTWGLQWSSGTGFFPSENELSRRLDERFEKILGLKAVSGGPYIIVSYPESIGYKLHTDCSVKRPKKTDRFATILIYLEDVEKGGHTYFPDLDISIKPKKGRALVWNSMTKDGVCDPTSQHEAQVATKGTKYILQRWYYYQNFPGLDKRPPVPPIPERRENQANVVCNEFRNGSCRMYNTWTYEVVRKY